MRTRILKYKTMQEVTKKLKFCIPSDATIIDIKIHRITKDYKIVYIKDNRKNSISLGSLMLLNSQKSREIRLMIDRRIRNNGLELEYE